MLRRVLIPCVSVLALAGCSKHQDISPESTATATATVAATASSTGSPSVGGPTLAAAPSASTASSARTAASAFRDFGMIGLLNTGASGDPNAPTAPWGRDDDPMTARGNQWGDATGDGSDGIGLGRGRLGGSHTKDPPKVRQGPTSVSGRLPPEVIQRIVRQNFGRFRLCYENGLRSDPKLEGDVTVSFTIQKDGSVTDVHGDGSMPDDAVKQCVTRGFSGLAFPEPEGGLVKVTYPIRFSPGDSSPAKLNGKALADARADDVKAALEKAGCTDVTRKENPPGVTSPTVFTAKKDGKFFTVIFVASIDQPLSMADIAKLHDAGVVKQDSGFLLAIAFDGDPDKSAAKALMDALVVTT